MYDGRPVALADALTRSADLDLEPVKQQLQHKPTAPWPRHVVNEVDLEYRRLLALHAAYPDLAVEPGPFLSEFWRLHRGTRDYRSQCEAVAGRPLAPAGTPGAGLDRAGELYRCAFGRQLPGAWTETDETEFLDPTPGIAG